MFNVVPKGITLFTTPASLKKAGITRYSPMHIGRMVKNGDIVGFQVGEQVWLPPEGVEGLLERERASLAGELGQGGRRPGQTSSDATEQPLPAAGDASPVDVFDASDHEEGDRKVAEGWEGFVS